MLLLAAAAACSDATGPKNALTKDESTELAAQLGNAVLGAPTSASGPSFDRVPMGASESSAPTTTTVHISAESLPCPQGGTTTITVDIIATVDRSTHSMTADVTGTNAPQECGFYAKRSVLFITGTPSITTTAHVEITNGLPSGAQTVSGKGSFDWKTKDGRSGSCQVDYEVTRDFGAHTRTIKGTFCGSTIEDTAMAT
jgi:hypothetical protein